ncbi:MAG: FAD-dependent oxidoreductase [Christensenellales bacterium]|jgi:hypothetical protein
MKKSYDVVVAGGGIAGIAASLAAARQGARVCLLEKAYALGGLATLGLIVIYLPLCDGDGVQMSGGICEELLKLSLVDGPGEIPAPWRGPSSRQARAEARYEVTYNAATLMINAERLLLESGVDLLYDVRLAAVQGDEGQVQSVTVDTKAGPMRIAGRAFVDATGDADLCFFAGEPTYSDDGNSRTGWYYSYDGQRARLHMQTDPFTPGETPADRPHYAGDDPADIARHMADMRAMIQAHARGLRERGEQAYPFLIPAYHGLRMTRRLDAPFVFSAEDERVWFADAIGMIGSWRERGKRYSLPYRMIRAPKHANLYAAGRCVSAEGMGWDLARVIPACAVTGQAAGCAAAMQAATGRAPEAVELQWALADAGVPLDETLFTRRG